MLRRKDAVSSPRRGNTSFAHGVRGEPHPEDAGGFFAHGVREERFSPFFFARQRKSRWR